jgi:hypothetical protein
VTRNTAINTVFDDISKRTGKNMCWRRRLKNLYRKLRVLLVSPVWPPLCVFAWGFFKKKKKQLLVWSLCKSLCKKNTEMAHREPLSRRAEPALHGGDFYLRVT